MDQISKISETMESERSMEDADEFDDIVEGLRGQKADKGLPMPKNPSQEGKSNRTISRIGEDDNTSARGGPGAKGRTDESQRKLSMSRQ
jgi:hypothetical protein